MNGFRAVLSVVLLVIALVLFVIFLLMNMGAL